MDNEIAFFKEQSRKDLLSYSVYCDKFFEINPHHEIIADHLNRLLKWDIQNLIIEMPPRAWKSRLMQEFISKLYWDYPRTDILYTGHSLNLLEWFSRNIRNRIQTREYQSLYNTRISSDSSAVKNWNVEWGWEFAIYGVWGWITGKGGNILICVKEWTKVITDKWNIAIELLLERVEWFRCLTYNHKTGEWEYKRILEWKRSENRQVYKIKTTSWLELFTTWDHQIYTVWQWYKKVEMTKPWEKVIIYKDTNWVSQLQETNRKTSIWDTKGNKNRDKALLLQPQVYGERGEVTQMQKMPWYICGEKRKDMQKLQGKQTNTIWYRMLNMLRYISTYITPEKVLLNGLQKQGALWKDVNSKSELETLNGKRYISEWVLQTKTKSIKERLKQLHNLFFNRPSCYSSQRQKSTKQLNGQSLHSLSYLPHETPQFQEDTISSIEPIERKHTVYDIKVEDNNNFFAENILVHNCDDPYATRQDAESETVRRTVSNWYWSTFLTRKQDDKAKQIIIMQRWREDDLVGEILEREWSKWTELKIPALNEKGESFWSSRFSRTYFEDIKRQSPLFFESQYQQNPVNTENGDFIQSYFIHYDQHQLESVKKYLSIVTFVDPAISQNQEADNTAIITAWIDTRSNFIYVLEVQAWKMLPDEIISRTFITQRKWGGKVWVESIAYQKMLILEMQKQMRIRNHFFTLEEIRPNTEKNAKIRTLLQPRYASHSVLHSNFMADLEAELLKFPNGKHDDMIDALSGCIQMFDTVNLEEENWSWESESFL